VLEKLADLLRNRHDGREVRHLLAALAEQLGQLGDVGRDPPRLVFGE